MPHPNIIMNNETFIEELNNLFSIEAAKNLYSSLSQCDPGDFQDFLINFIDNSIDNEDNILSNLDEKDLKEWYILVLYVINYRFYKSGFKELIGHINKKLALFSNTISSDRLDELKNTNSSNENYREHLNKYEIKELQIFGF